MDTYAPETFLYPDCIVTIEDRRNIAFTSLFGLEVRVLKTTRAPHFSGWFAWDQGSDTGCRCIQSMALSWRTVSHPHNDAARISAATIP